MRDSIYMQYNPWWEEEYSPIGIIPRTSNISGPVGFLPMC